MARPNVRKVPQTAVSSKSARMDLAAQVSQGVWGAKTRFITPSCLRVSGPTS
jgi:hypothetical protein